MHRLQQQLLDDGYAIVPQALSAARIAELRRVCADTHARYRERNLSIGRFLDVPELASVPFDPAVVAGLRAILGEHYTTIPEFTMQTASFGPWHTDGGSQGRAAHLYDPDYLQVECAIYLQDNSSEYGGGLDVLPRSHREIATLGSPYSLGRRVTRRLANALRRPYSVPSKAGDLVAFHFRLLHRSTPSRAAVTPEDRTKYAVFWGATSTGRHARLYMDHLRTRQESNYVEMSQVRYPESYPTEVVESIRRQALTVASF
ncbi:MAG: phytanoyl-CoA dioxygenase family protein [Vicinamibacterales bacterium]